MTEIEKDHAEMVSRLVKPGGEIARDITPQEAHMLHMVAGVSGEAGELLDAIKKTVVYRKPIDVMNVIEELGDIEFYMQGLRQSLGLVRADVLAHNINKLSKRYGNAYSNRAAQERADKVAS